MGVPERSSSDLASVLFHRAGTQPDGGATEASNGIAERSATHRATRSIILLLYLGMHCPRARRNSSTTPRRSGDPERIQFVAGVMQTLALAFRLPEEAPRHPNWRPSPYSFETVLPPAFTTHILVPSKATPTGPLPTLNVPMGGPPN